LEAEDVALDDRAGMLDISSPGRFFGLELDIEAGMEVTAFAVFGMVA
jgi:hypothetical protein